MRAGYFIALVFSGAYFINLVWEKAQMPLYDVSLPGWQCWLVCMRASFWDAVIITGTYLVIALLFRTFFWMKTAYRLYGYGISVGITGAIAIFIEQRAMLEGRWAYSALMPTVFGVGLSPLVQLPLLAIVTYMGIYYLHERRQRTGS